MVEAERSYKTTIKQVTIKQRHKDNYFRLELHKTIIMGYTKRNYRIKENKKKKIKKQRNKNLKKGLTLFRALKMLSVEFFAPS